MERHFARRHRYALIVIAILLIPVVGYALMHALVYILPVSQDTTLSNALFTIILIALGLAIPYWMLKLGSRNAHLSDPKEKEITLKDIPKDQY